MRTTVTIDEKMVRELLELSRAKNKTAAVAFAIKEQIRRTKLKKLADILGTIELDEQEIKNGDRSDMSRAQWLEGIRAKNDK